MTPLTLPGSALLYHADCRDALRALPDNSIDSCVTDPPYALVSIVKRFGSPNAAPAKGNDAYMRASTGFMGQQWDTGECAMDPAFWVEVLRVLKPGAHLAAFGASRGYHRMVCAIEDAGFEIRDSLMWIYGTGFPKSHNVMKGVDKHLGAESVVLSERETGWSGALGGKTALGGIGDAADVRCEYGAATPEAAEWEGWGTALKPAFEPIVLARKPLSEGTVAANVLRWRTGALNIDACRVGTEDNLNGGRYSDNKQGDDGNTYGSGINLRSAADYVQPAGRWPANVVHDGSDEVVDAFPQSGGQQGRARIGGAKAGNIYSKFDANVSSNPEPRGDSGSAARFFYSAKASKADRAGSRHPTVKPVSLMQWLCRLVTPPGGVVLDPFAGSGTTGQAAILEGFKVVLCEREDQYVEDIVRRFGAESLLDLGLI